MAWTICLYPVPCEVSFIFSLVLPCPILSPVLPLHTCSLCFCFFINLLIIHLLFIPVVLHVFSPLCFLPCVSFVNFLIKPLSLSGLLVCNTGVLVKKSFFTRDFQAYPSSAGLAAGWHSNQAGAMPDSTC